MAYNYNWGSGSNPADEGTVSKFNAGLLKMKRLHDLQALLNLINVNLTAFNEEYGVYNFELKLSICDNLFQETESKLSEKERDDTNELREAIHKFIAKNPICETRRSKIYPYNNAVKFHSDRWKVLNKWLFKYETIVRRLLDAHGLDTAYEGDEGLL